MDKPNVDLYYMLLKTPKNNYRKMVKPSIVEGTCAILDLKFIDNIIEEPLYRVNGEEKINNDIVKGGNIFAELVVIL